MVAPLLAGSMWFHREGFTWILKLNPWVGRTWKAHRSEFSWTESTSFCHQWFTLKLLTRHVPSCWIHSRKGCKRRGCTAITDTFLFASISLSEYISKMHRFYLSRHFCWTSAGTAGWAPPIRTFIMAMPRASLTAKPDGQPDEACHESFVAVQYVKDHERQEMYNFNKQWKNIVTIASSTKMLFSGQVEAIFPWMDSLRPSRGSLDFLCHFRSCFGYNVNISCIIWWALYNIDVYVVVLDF